MGLKICRRTGKLGYRSLKEAEAALRLIEANDMSMARRYERVKVEKSAFKCLHCPRWHLSSLAQSGDSDNGVNLR